MVNGCADVTFLPLSILHALQELGVMKQVLGSRAHLRLNDLGVFIRVLHLHRVSFAFKNLGHREWREIVRSVAAQLGIQGTLPWRKIIEALL